MRFPALLLPALIVLIVPGSALAAEGPWWNGDWKSRALATVPAGAERLLRMEMPEGVDLNTLRCILDGEGEPLVHWTQTVEVRRHAPLAADPKVHFGFPRIIRAAGGDLLVFYRVGTSHAAGPAKIAMRRSADNGKTWSAARILWEGFPTKTAHNPVAVVTRGGEILLWCSAYQWSPREKGPCYWSVSKDDGKTWSAFEPFGGNEGFSTYYMVDAIQTADGLLGGSADFKWPGVGNCHVPIWHSADDGKTWQVRSRLTSPNEDIGDETALLETSPGEILCILRDRYGKHKDTWAFRSADGGKTWSEKEPMRPMLGCTLQRPFLTRLDEKTVLLSGRDWDRKRIVVYVSRDNAKTFGERHVFDEYLRDGAYTAAVATGPREAYMVWYSDGGKKGALPDIEAATFQVLDEPKHLWIRLPESADTTKAHKLHLYHGNPSAAPGEDRTDADVRKRPFTVLAPE